MYVSRVCIRVRGSYLFFSENLLLSLARLLYPSYTSARYDEFNSTSNDSRKNRILLAKTTAKSFMKRFAYTTTEESTTGETNQFLKCHLNHENQVPNKNPVPSALKGKTTFNRDLLI